MTKPLPYKPILFKPEMVCAMLEGRKTQTRRLLDMQPPPDTCSLIGPEMYAPVVIDRNGEMDAGPEIWGVYAEEWGCNVAYRPGDLLWVREKHSLVTHPFGERDHYAVFYPADGARRPLETFALGEPNLYRELIDKQRGQWRSPIHMHRWASRLTLEVTGVKVERLQDISEADAIAEGISLAPAEWKAVPTHPYVNRHVAGTYHGTAAQAYEYLWRSIHDDDGPASYAENPWVVAVTFKVHACNVENVAKQREAA